MSIQQLAQVRRHYRYIAPVYPAFEVLFGLPPGARREATRRLNLSPGNRVLEVGVGTGRNLPFLRGSVGPTGRVLGVDVSSEMPDRADRTRRRHGWANVDLSLSDAGAYVPPEPVHAILFSLSYSVLPDPRAVLEHLWGFLRGGGKVVVLDGALSPGALGSLARLWAVPLSRLTVLGDATRRSWEDLRALTPDVSVDHLGRGTYLICTGTKLT